MPALTSTDNPSRVLIEQALREICNRVVFARSPRARTLLSYLIRKSLLDGEQTVNELGIGLTVFRREPATYNPGEDPIVRVEVGRLRRRLAIYCAQNRPEAAWQLCLPELPP